MVSDLSRASQTIVIAARVKFVKSKGIVLSPYYARRRHSDPLVKKLRLIRSMPGQSSGEARETCRDLRLNGEPRHVKGSRNRHFRPEIDVPRYW